MELDRFGRRLDCCFCQPKEDEIICMALTDFYNPKNREHLCLGCTFYKSQKPVEVEE